MSKFIEVKVKAAGKVGPALINIDCVSCVRPAVDEQELKFGKTTIIFSGNEMGFCEETYVEVRRMINGE